MSNSYTSVQIIKCVKHDGQASALERSAGYVQVGTCDTPVQAARNVTIRTPPRQLLIYFSPYMVIIDAL